MNGAELIAEGARSQLVGLGWVAVGMFALFVSVGLWKFFRN